MDLVNDVCQQYDAKRCPLNGNPLDEDDGNLLDEVVNLFKDEYLMYLQRVQKGMKKEIQFVLDL